MQIAAPQLIAWLVGLLGLAAGCRSHQPAGRDAASPISRNVIAAPSDARAPTDGAGAGATAWSTGAPVGSAAPARAGSAAPVGARSAAADAAGQAAPADAAQNRITISIAPPRRPGGGVAKRCAIAGDPISTECVAGGSGLAFDRAGVMYIEAGGEVRRYRRAAGSACRLDPAGAPIALPPVPRRLQRIDGPVYMRSGGPDWHVVGAGGAVYATDFLAGLYRVDGGKPVPVCTDVFGYHSVARFGHRLLIGRSGIEQLVLGGRGRCKARSVSLGERASLPAGGSHPEAAVAHVRRRTKTTRGDLYVAGDRLYVARRGGGLTRLDGTRRVEVALGTRVCSIVGLTACGDGACAIDSNCMQIVQLDANGTLVRAIGDHQLFDTRPWSLDGAATARGGTVYLFARHRDVSPGGHEVCEASIYEVVPAVFAR